jgi:DNA (cytosine-5)-methyltransferase 1
VVDLFAGAGGCSTGLLQAATKRGERVELVAVNHWPTAVETHTRNHPEARHFCASIETVDPRVAVPSGKLDLLIAAPECTHHSTARGGKPINDQSRASAWHIMRWLELLSVEHVLIENVPEFQTWGPLGRNGRPLKSRKGETFRAFISALESYGYRVEWKVLNAADYGAATTRRRLFIRASRGRKAIAWPQPTHSKTGAATLFGGRQKWRAAREIIDWSLPSQSIFARKRPLQPATIRRIIEGLRRFGGPELQPFLVQLTHGVRTLSVDAPFPTVTTANRGEIGIAEPFIVQSAHGSGNGKGDGGRVASVNGPLGTPFLIPFLGEREGQAPRSRSVDDPLQTVTASNPIGVVEPFVLQQQSGGVARPVNEPAPTVSTDGAIALVQPFILGQQSNSAPRTTADPIPTVAAAGKIAFVEPFIVTQRNNNTPKTLDEPVPALCTGGHIALAEPFLTKYTSTGQAYSVDQPIDTITTRDRFGLVQPVVNGYVLDIRFRMLQPHELSAAMSFPKHYSFAGNKGDAIRQIGNAVDCSVAEALCGAILDSRRSPRRLEVVA